MPNQLNHFHSAPLKTGAVGFSSVAAPEKIQLESKSPASTCLWDQSQYHEGVNIKRRNLLFGAIGITSAVVLGRHGKNSHFLSRSDVHYDAQYLIGGAFKLDVRQAINHPHQLDQQTSRRRAFRLDLRNGRYDEIETTAPIHGLESNPRESSLSVGCSRGGRLLSMVDWRLGREAKVMELPAHRIWYGHLAFSDDGRYAILPMAEYIERVRPIYEEQKDPNAFLAVLDLESWKIVDEVPTTDGRMHDLARADADLFIGLSASHERTPTLQAFDFQKRRIERIPLIQSNGESAQTKQRSNPGHLKIAGDQVFVVLSGQAAVPIEAHGLWVTVDWRLNRIQGDSVARLRQSGELLSVDFDESLGNVWVTAPDRKEILIWRASDGDLVKILPFSEPPRSVQIVPEHGLAIVGTLRELKAIDLRSFAERSDFSQIWRGWGPRPFYHSHTRIQRS